MGEAKQRGDFKARKRAAERANFRDAVWGIAFFLLQGILVGLMFYGCYAIFLETQI